MTKAICYWLISTDPTHLGYTNCHWLISMCTHPIVKLLIMKANCYWLISNDLTHLPYMWHMWGDMTPICVGGSHVQSPHVTWLTWQVSKIDRITWHHAKFPSCDLAPCQILWRHLAPCQLDKISPSHDMGLTFLMIIPKPPSQREIQLL